MEIAGVITLYYRSFILDHKIDLERICDYDIIHDMNQIGLLKHDFVTGKSDPLSNLLGKIFYYGYFLRWLRYLLMIPNPILFSVNYSMIICDPGILMIHHRSVLLFALTVVELTAFMCMRLLKNAAKDPKTLIWLHIYRQKRSNCEFKYLSDDDWNHLRRIHRTLYLACWYGFRIIVPLTSLYLWSGPLQVSDGFCSLTVWTSCSMVLIHSFYSIGSFFPLYYLYSSYSIIIRARLKVLINNLDTNESECEYFLAHHLMTCCKNYMLIYTDYKNSCLILNKFLGIVFTCGFTFLVTLYYLGYLTGTTRELRLLFTYLMTFPLGLTYILGYFFANLSSSEDREFYKRLMLKLIKTQLPPNTKIHIMEILSMMYHQPIVYKYFDVFRFTSMNILKFYQEMAASLMLVSSNHISF
ncbi:uncharacterized protein LOC141852100 [Brevipalpus obovatus]|uniref:uncharacterized protein LOC141852100 n=1 Tax=Brevipalpus obovatus TaxID=246614 RepID=UPI003D9E8B1A